MKVCKHHHAKWIQKFKMLLFRKEQKLTGVDCRSHQSGQESWLDLLFLMQSYSLDKTKQGKTNSQCVFNISKHSISC